MLDLLPAWWDGLTFLRLVALFGSVVAWLAVGWFATPKLSAFFDDVTHGYVRWMQAEFDKMFLEVSSSLCVLSIVASVSP